MIYLHSPKRKPDRIFIFMLAIAFALIASLFSGCYTPKKAAEQTHRALDKFPETSAKILRDRFPCVDGEIRPGDSTEYFKLRDSLASINDYYANLLNNIEPEIQIQKDLSDSMKVIVLTENLKKCNERDALRERQITQLRLKTLTPVFIHDTIPVKDNADVFLAQAETKNERDKNAKLTEENTKLEKKVAKRNKIILWESILLLLLLIITAYKIWKNLTTIKFKNT